MKRRITLSEENLHHILKESVKRILNESDWKTHYNAYKTSLERDDPRADNFKDYATDLINKKYDLSRTKFGKDYIDNSNVDLEEPNIVSSYASSDYNDGENEYDFDDDFNFENFLYKDNGVKHRSYYDSKKFPSNDTTKFRNYDEFDDYLDQEEDNIGDTTYDQQGESYKNFIRANKDISGLISGKTKYVNGKGWQTESLDRKIKKTLRESLKKLNKR